MRTGFLWSRDPFHPSSVSGTKVFVESHAGERSGFSDEEYSAAGRR